MKALKVIKGDATSPQASGPKVIAHCCNDMGGWGKGFVLALSKRWPEPEADYRRWHRERSGNDFGLGALRLVAVRPDTWVANLIGQHGTRRGSAGPPIRYDAVAKGLMALGDEALRLRASVHMPRIGCGLAGGKWERIEPLVVESLCARDVPVTVYDFD
ncbi:macro domain-containing protein [Winogradskya humida]|uniref:Appr-1-p processing protein n=1 Tax=Winogradskya humida TaxID=113566 RepID=A0ABQ3ZPE9_9ACTN|nr:macro domain-containing protein [Actinoplanes humidus]GIE20460.1 Appr-1-p processing protein [Actinoplanes humidus]